MRRQTRVLGLLVAILVLARRASVPVSCTGTLNSVGFEGLRRSTLSRTKYGPLQSNRKWDRTLPTFAKGFGEISSTTGGKLDDWDEWMAEMEIEEQREKESRATKGRLAKPKLVSKIALEKSVTDGNGFQTERLNKLLSHWGIASRRGVDNLVAEGRVWVNDKRVKKFGFRVDTQKDIIKVDGKRITGEAVVGGLSREAPKPRWVLLYKPKGVSVTTNDEKETKKGVLSLVARAHSDRLLPVGRLDKNSAGLILLTNEKVWLHPLTHPKSALGRRYIIVVNGIPKARTIEEVKRKGIQPQGYPRPIKPASFRIISGDEKKKSWSKIELGFSGSDVSRPRDIRKLFDGLGFEIKSITRNVVGPFQIAKEMKPGEWRELANQEIEELKQSLRQKLVKADPNMKVRTDSESISSKESHTHGSKQHSDGEDFEDLSFDDFLSED